MKPFARWILNAAIIGGLTLAVWPLAQTAYGRWNQQQLEAQWKAQPKAPQKPKEKKVVVASLAKPSKSEKTTATTVSIETKNLRVKRKAQPWPLTKLSIPDIDLNTFVVQGWDDAALRRGPGHDPNSSLPGEGNCAIAGHRNVYGSFFYRLDELLPGAKILLENRDGKFTYVVDQTITTPDTNTQVLQPPPAGSAPQLTLVTCTIPHTNNRIVLQASLSEE